MRSAQLGHEDRLPELGISRHDVERVSPTRVHMRIDWRMCFPAWTGWRDDPGIGGSQVLRVHLRQARCIRWIYSRRHVHL
jgi:hypothetical protein